MQLRRYSMLARALPFAVYIAFLVAESLLKGRINGLWLYGVQIAAVVALLAWFWPEYEELRRPSARPADWGLSLLVGVAVFLLWVHLDFQWAQLGTGRGLAADLSASGEKQSGFLLRLLGAVLVVPLMEELFWRSFIMRWLDNSNFLAVDPRTVSGRSFLITSVLFGAEHHLWLAGVVAGLAYGWLYRRSGNLWTVVVAHSLTNLVLEFWVRITGNWHFF
jgi:CAAX protease family protein